LCIYPYIVDSSSWELWQLLNASWKRIKLFPWNQDCSKVGRLVISMQLMGALHSEVLWWHNFGVEC
jgi:hypothetical protein